MKVIFASRFKTTAILGDSRQDINADNVMSELYRGEMVSKEVNDIAAKIMGKTVKCVHETRLSFYKNSQYIYCSRVPFRPYKFMIDI